jgi:hypothetical protein
MTRSQLAMVALSVLVLVAVALVAGVGQSPAIVDQPDQPGQPNPSTGATAMSLGTSLVTAGLTTALGFVAFVLGQFALKLFVDPIQEQARAVGNVTHALTYYHNVGREALSGSDLNRAAEAQRVYRDLAARLRTNLRVIPFYHFFSRLGLVLPRERVWHASTALIGLANTVHKGPAADDVNRYRYEVEKSSGIDR